jgi:subtilisin family serine protease
MKVADQDDDAFSATDALAVAVEKGAKVVSASLTLWPDEEADVPMRNAREVLFVVAAGNGKSEIDDDHPVFPPSYSGLDNMITVGASDPDDNVAYFSNYGAKAVHVFAPGAEIMSTVRTNIFGNRYGRLSGTSQATPQVALAAALIWGNLGNLPAKAVKARIMDTSDFVGDTTQKGASGRLNLAKAIMIDHDLMELNDSPHTLLVGTIQNTSVSFAEAGQNCGEVDNNGIRTYDVVDDRVVRVVVENQGSKSVLFSNGGRRTVGTVCDAMIDFLTSDGTTIHKSISDVSDVIWGLWHPHDSGRAQTGP